MAFGAVQEGPKVGARDLMGRPLIVYVNAHKKNIGTKFSQGTGKLADPLICDVVDLRPPMGGDPILYRNVWLFSVGIIKSLKSVVGQDPRLVTFSSSIGNNGFQNYLVTDLSGDKTACEMGEAWIQANADFTRSPEPDDPEPFVPNTPQQHPNQGWPQGSVPAQQFQQGPPPQGQFPQPQYQQPVQQSPQSWGQPQQGWGQQQQPAHHEQGPPPAWAQGAVQQAPPQPQYQQPPLPPQPNPGQQSILERLAAQHQNNDAARQAAQQGYDQQQERQQYGY